MKIVWTTRATGDLVRVGNFLDDVAPKAAMAAKARLSAAALRLADFPRVGRRIAEHDVGEVRRLIVGNYEMRYEVRAIEVRILRIWHTREKR